MVSAYFHSPNTVDSIGVEFHKVGQIFAYIGLYFLTITVILPNFKANYKYLVEISFILIMFVSAGLINYFTVVQEVNEQVISIKNTTFGSLLTIMGLAFLIYSLIRRSNQIKNILNKDEVEVVKTKPFITFSLLILVIALFFLFARFGLEIFPAYGYFLPLSATILYFIFFFFQKTELFFLTPIELHRIVITQKTSGLELYSKSFSSLDNISDGFFSEILTGATSSIKTVIDAKRGLDQIRYFDRVIQSAEEDDIVAYIIVSDYNVITTSIAKWLAKKFQKEYLRKYPNKESKFIEKEEFKKFDKYAETARAYIPF
jgi:uncharacterized membrane protein YidH (DUF202 family)